MCGTREDMDSLTEKKKIAVNAAIFASVATLGRPEYLNEAYFPADYFDYVIIDQNLGHPVTDQYRRIVDYFSAILTGINSNTGKMNRKISTKSVIITCHIRFPEGRSTKEIIVPHSTACMIRRIIPDCSGERAL